MHRPQDEVVPLHEPFETALRGFNRQQVLAHIESLDGHISMVAADRESALSQVAELSRTIDHLRSESDMLAHLHQAEKKANEQVERMHQSPMVAASARIQRIVQLAEEEAADLKARAEKEIADLHARANQEITEMRDLTTSQAEKMLQETTQKCKQIEDYSERSRKDAQEKSEREIAQQEAEANARIQHREKRSIAGLHLMLRIVGPYLAARIAEVERQEAGLAELRARAGQEVTALETFRDEIGAQIAATRQVLADALQQVQQTTVEHPDTAQAAYAVPLPRDGRADPGNEPVQLVHERASRRRHPTSST